MATRKEVSQFEVWIVDPDPSVGAEVQKARPCVIVSSNILNEILHTVIVVPMTSSIRNFPSRVYTNFENKEGQFMVDQVKAIDKGRLMKKIGEVSDEERDDLIDMLGFVFLPE